MTDRSTLNEKLVTVPAGQRLAVEIGISDFLFFQTFPAGLTASLNDAAPVALPEGLLHKGPAGNGNFRALALVNATGSPLAARILYGQGEINVAGSVTLVGSIPLPAGAATAAKQDNLLAAVATAAKQDAQTALLTALNAVATETPDFVTVAASTDQTFSNCRSLALDNIGPTNVTVTVGGTARTLPAGEGRAFQVSGPFNKLAPVNVAVPAGGACVVATTT